MIPAVIIVVDEGCNLGFEVVGQVVIFKQNAVFQSLMPAFDFPPGVRMVWRAAYVDDLSLVEPLCKIAGDVRGPVDSTERTRQ